MPSTSCRLRLVRVGSSANSISIHMQESARGSSWACRLLPKQVQACKARAFFARCPVMLSRPLGVFGALSAFGALVPLPARAGNTAWINSGTPEGTLITFPSFAIVLL